jgi:hypothetical protein
MNWNKFAMPTEISNEQLAEVIRDKNREDPSNRGYRRIQRLIRDYTWPGESYHALPQACRWEFLGRIGSRLRAERERGE